MFDNHDDHHKLLRPTSGRSWDASLRDGCHGTQLVMIIRCENATARAMIQRAKAVVIHKRGRSLGDLACDVHGDGSRS